MRRVIVWALPLTLVAVLAADGEGAEPEPIKPVVSWSGTVADPALEANKPPLGLVVNHKAFAALWKTWRPAEAIPNIDFGSYFVLVITRPKGSTFIIQILERPDGKTAVVSGQGPIGEKELPGFGYGLAVFPRNKVKMIGGKEIPAR